MENKFILSEELKSCINICVVNLLMCTDAVTLVLYNTIVIFCDMPVIPGGQYGLAVLAFFTVSCGGMAVGAIFGLLTALITKTTQECRGV